MKKEKPIVNFDIGATVEDLDPQTITKGPAMVNIADKLDYRNTIKDWIERTLISWDTLDFFRNLDGLVHCLKYEFPNLDLRSPIQDMENYLDKYYELKKMLWLRTHETDHLWTKQFAIVDFRIAKGHDLASYIISLCAKHRMLSLGAKSTYGGSRMESNEE